MQRDANVPNQIDCNPSEKILIVTTCNKAPFLASFPTNPIGGTWLQIQQDPLHLIDKRIVLCPANAGSQLTFAVTFDEQIQTGDPDPVAIYRITFTSLMRPNDPVISSVVVVPQGGGPVLNQFTFQV